MGSNNNDNQDTSQVGGNSGSDPRGRLQNQSNYQQNRFESQQGPLANAMAMNYGRGSEADYGNYTDIMNQYRNVASGQGAGAVTGGGSYASGAYGGPGYSAFHVTPGKITPKMADAPDVIKAGTASAGPDPFASYDKYKTLSDTGGFSAQDMADLRARGTAPIRAAYANANDAISRQRSLQGGYSPNAIAAQVKMAREQGQSGADAMQNVNAGIIGARNAGQLAGMGGMAGIEGQRYGMAGDLSKFNTGLDFQGQSLNAANKMDINKFNVGNDLTGQQYNTGLDYQGQTYNADADARAQAGNISLGQSNAAANASASNAGTSAANAAANAAAGRQMQALGGMTQLYGTTPGMSATFGNQALGAVNSGGNFGNNLYSNDINAQRAPGAFDTTMNRINQGMNLAGQAGNAIYPWLQGGNGGNSDLGPNMFGGSSTYGGSDGSSGGYDSGGYEDPGQFYDPYGDQGIWG